MTVEIQPVMISGGEEFDAAFSRIVNEGTDAVIVQPSLPTKRAAELALKDRLPAATSEAHEGRSCHGIEESPLAQVHIGL